jgi:thiamine biosynthesis lipoprotein
MNKQRAVFAFAAIATVLVLGWAIYIQPSATGPAFGGATMGTSYSVHVRDCKEPICGFLEEYVRRRLETLNGIFSHYDRNSELSGFNQSSSTDWISVSEELYRVVAYGLAISRESEGAFDITAAHSINAWGFGPGEPAQPPDAETIAEALRLTGYDKLEVRADPPALRKRDAGIALDLSAIAKGYAVDQVALALERFGHTDYLVEIGGEVRTGGTKPNRQLWRVGLESPAGQLDYNYIVTPRDEAVATSGDYRNYYVIDGQRYSHAIDPKTGRPVTHNLASVSVIQPSALQADALATLLLVLGPEKGLEYAERNGLPALFWVRAESGPAAITTTAFQDYLLPD